MSANSTKQNPNFAFILRNIERRDIRYIVLEGGTRSGKTYSVLSWIIRFCIAKEQKNAGVEISVVRKTLAALKPTALKDFISMLKEWGLYDENDHNKTENTYHLNGNTVSFFGADNDKKLRGFSCHILYCNEALELASEEFLQLKIRTSGKIIIDYNPSENNHYLYDELDSDENSILISTTYRDNPHLPQAQIREIEKLRTIDPMLYQIYADGKRGQLKGLVFTNWGVCKEMPKQLQKRGHGLDFGFSNDPSVLLDVGIFNGEIYVDEMIYQTGLTNPNLSKLIKENSVNSNNLIVADSSDPRSIAELKSYGHYIEGVFKGRDSIRHSIISLKEYKINFTERSVNAIKEVKNYKWKVKDGQDLNEPIDAFNHALDALRYWAIKNIAPRKGFNIS